MATEEVSKPPSLPPRFKQISDLEIHRIDLRRRAGRPLEPAFASPEQNERRWGVDVGEELLHEVRPQRAPPRRGRGRPPKRKTAADAEVAKETEVSASPARPRGRPRKDANAPPPAPKEVKSGGVVGSKSGRPRGRPPKVKPQQAQVGVQAS
ncbi:hypothetical protein Acr_00g0063450 [Actinidia rufa]|uniref:Uncharacterized protein n=1 Tax=Actinidia rufa TaxID=165716 RepID=A0A7J0DR33_9ERIC|nr:hypothetical protein Acr_00g0063450 [Actinidia rufa]